MTDKYLLKLWREACLKRDKVCQLCSAKRNLDCHHIVRRAVRTTRYDMDNGIMLCRNCHVKEADTNSGRFRIYKIIGDDRCSYLDKMERITLKNYLVSVGITRNEWLDECAKILKSYLTKNVNSGTMLETEAT